MTETPKTFEEWERRKWGPAGMDRFWPYALVKEAFEVGHAAGQMEGLEAAAKLVDETRPEVPQPIQFGLEVLAKTIRALAKDRERA